MSTLLKTSLLGLAMVSTAAMAELSDFTGFEAGVGLNMVGASALVNLKNSMTYSNEYGQQTTAIKLHGGYGIELSKDTVLHFGLDYNTANINAGYMHDADINLLIKDVWSLSVAPGMLLSDKTLAYFKLSYEAGKFSSSHQSATNYDASGVGYGFGVRTQINKTTFLETEVKQVNYNTVIDESKNEISLKSTVGSVGVVFKF